MCAGTFLYADFLDDDMDGVSNEEDKCPNSAFSDIVGADGCKVDSVVFKKEHHFDISVGLSYSKNDDTQSDNAQNFSLGYYYGNFSSYLYTSNTNLQNGQSGVDDTTLSFYYKKADNEILYKAGAGFYLPTSDINNNQTDYFLSAKILYYLDDYDFSIELQHTFMKDTDTKDTNRLSLSAGYILSDKTYTSLTYTTQDSIYADEKRLQNATLYLNYFFDTHWFVSGEFSLGLSNSATNEYVGMRVGYYF